MTSHYLTALAAFRRNDLDTAFGAINAAMTSDEAANPAVFALLGESLARLGSLAEAAQAYEEAHRRGGPEALAHRKRAIQLSSEAGDTERAFLLALQHQKDDPADADIAALIARELRARGETALLPLFAARLAESNALDHLRLAAELVGEDNRNPLNLTIFARLSALKPDDPFPRFKYYSVAREFCDFDVLDEADRFLNDALARGQASVLEGETPYSNLLHCGDEALNRLATNNRDIPGPPPPDLSARRRARPHVWGERLRIGYLTSDLWDDHATMRLFGGVLEAHDRTSFDITVFDYTPERFAAFDTGGRARWQPIVPIGGLDDEAAAETIRRTGCDILVDLKGHTGGSRSKILNRMVAPVQVAWLGFPGSVVHIDLDYVIGDAIVLPDSARPHYHEAFCRLPGSYQPNDPVHRPLPEPTPRQALGLPDNAFVFASFNASRKITPTVIDLWAEILSKTGESVLWLMVDHDLARGHVLKRMARHGIDAERIVFAPKTDYETHVSRLQAADLGLDTFPYNGHTTTSDKLWAGLPVLTVRGSNFASRVSESLLTAAGLPELVADSAEAYVEMAAALWRAPERLRAFRQHLETNRKALDLFDHRAFAAKLERAYRAMADRAKAGLAPDDLDIQAGEPSQPQG